MGNFYTSIINQYMSMIWLELDLTEDQAKYKTIQHNIEIQKTPF